MIDSEKVYVSCNLCGADDYSVVSETTRCEQTRAGPFTFDVRLVCCKKCGLVYWNPRKSGEELQHYYLNAYRAPVPPEHLPDIRRNMIQSRVRMLSRFVNEGRLLEIGSGEGYFLEKALAIGMEAVGVEPSPSYAEISRRIVPAATIHCMGFEEFENEGSFDIVCSFFVLEHVLDPMAFLKKCRDVLKVKGRLYLELPDIGLYPCQKSDMIWYEHTYHFSQATIQRMLKMAGFSTVAIESPGPSYSFGMAIVAERTGLAKGPRRLGSLNAEDHDAAMSFFRSHFDHLRRYRQAVRDEIETLQNELIERNCKMAVYGTGAFQEFLLTGTSLEIADIAIVIDDNSEKWGTLGNGKLLISSPTDLAQSGVDIVLIASDFFEEQMLKNVKRWSRSDSKQYQAFCPHSRAIIAMGEEGANPPER